jgi:hypothetical protein
MATFIEEAKLLLSNEEFVTLELLGKKSADFETTPEEDKKLVELKAKVKTAMAERDRLKNLAFIADGAYSIIDLLKAAKATKEQINDAIKILFPAPAPVITDVIATYTKGDKKYELKWGERLDREFSALIKEGGIKALVKNLTPFGTTWIHTSTTPDVGPYAGKPTFHNVNDVVLRFKFDKAELKKALKIA